MGSREEIYANALSPLRAPGWRCRCAACVGRQLVREPRSARSPRRPRQRPPASSPPQVMRGAGLGDVIEQNASHADPPVRRAAHRPAAKATRASCSSPARPACSTSSSTRCAPARHAGRHPCRRTAAGKAAVAVDAQPLHRRCRALRTAAIRRAGNPVLSIFVPCQRAQSEGLYRTNDARNSPISRSAPPPTGRSPPTNCSRCAAKAGAMASSPARKPKRSSPSTPARERDERVVRLLCRGDRRIRAQWHPEPRLQCNDERGRMADRPGRARRRGRKLCRARNAGAHYRAGRERARPAQGLCHRADRTRSAERHRPDPRWRRAQSSPHITAAECRILRRVIFASGGYGPAAVSRYDAEMLFRLKDETLVRRQCAPSGTTCSSTASATT